MMRCRSSYSEHL